MNSADFEKLAARLAKIATSADFEKTAFPNVSEFLGSDAGRYLMGGVGGATAGALLGATQPDNEKRKRNMLYYGALGTVGGLGVAHLANSFNSQPTGPLSNQQQKAVSDAAAADAFTEHLTNNAPGTLMRHGTGMGAGLIANRYISTPLAKGTATSAAAHTQELARAQAQAVRKMQAGNQTARENVTELFGKKMTGLKQRQALALADTAAKARAAQSLTGVPSHVAIDKLKAQQAAEIALKNKNYTAGLNRLRSGQTASELADAAKFTKGMKGRGRALSALNLLLQVAPSAAAYYGGTKLPAALSPFAPETSK